MDPVWSEVLAQYAPPLQGMAIAHAGHDGFSGARIWRVRAPAGELCLRAWPAEGPTIAELQAVHQLLGRAAHLPFVPRVLSTRAGTTWVLTRDHLWDLTTWMSGSADQSALPDPQRVRAALTALAQLHDAWSEPGAEAIECPAIQRRQASYRTWQDLVGHGWRPAWAEAHPLTTAARHAWDLVQRRVNEVPRRLDRWCGQRVAVQPCLCDLWRAHVLFTGEQVTGLIDYGSVKRDHVAVDLARLIGSLVGDDVALRGEALDAYDRLRPLAPWEQDLVADLDHTGTILAATHWLRWLYHEKRVFPSPAAVLERLDALIRRLQGPDRAQA